MLTYSIGIATYMEDRKLAPLNQVIGTVMRLALFNPRLLSFCGWAYLWSGQPQTALECQERSVRFGMQGPFTVASYGCAATACVQLKRFDAALAYCEKGLAMSDTYATFYSAKAAALALKGNLPEARKWMDRYREMLPERTLEVWRRENGYGGTELAGVSFEGLRLAGLPEN